MPLEYDRRDHILYQLGVEETLERIQQDMIEIKEKAERVLREYEELKNGRLETESMWRKKKERQRRRELLTKKELESEEDFIKYLLQTSEHSIYDICYIMQAPTERIEEIERSLNLQNSKVPQTDH